MEVTVKAFLPTEGGMEIRRVPFSMGNEGVTGRFKRLVALIRAAFPTLKGKAFSLTWKDSDGDAILMSSDEELREALDESTTSVLALFITCEETESIYEVPIEETAENGADKAEDKGRGDSQKGNHDREDPFADPSNWPFMGPMGGPPPPPFFTMGRGGYHRGPMHCGGRGRRHQGGMMPGCIPPPPPPPPPFPMRRGFGRGGMFAGPPPHPFYGPMGKWCRGFYGKGHPHGGPMGNHGNKNCEGCHGMKAWKKEMRDAVPKAHRRWAKSFIRNWRMENLKNSTTTTSDSDADNEKQPLTREACNVPEVYQQWLEIRLPRWHKNWGGKKCGEVCGAKGEKQKNPYKDLVPVEFRKWVRFFLNKHFGQRNSPRFDSSSVHCPDGQQEQWGRSGWGRRGKGQYLRSAVPANQRAWVRRFIMAWRFENNIPTGMTRASDSDDTDVDTMAPNAGVPEDYAKWLRSFLPRWHMWRGLFSREKAMVMQEDMKQFKDSVPMEFRRWVKFHLCRRYGNVTKCQGQPPTNDDRSRYQQWLRVFKNKWLAAQSKGSDSDVLCLTSSDEEAFSATGTDSEMESSMKKLRLSGEAKEAQMKQKSVRFDEDEELSSDSDEDGSDFQHGKNDKGLNREFRKLAHEALYNWDAQPTRQTEAMQGADNTAQEDIPPIVYRWMVKKMMKMQLKKAKQEKRAMKKEMKAAMRMAKHARRGF